MINKDIMFRDVVKKITVLCSFFCLILLLGCSVEELRLSDHNQDQVLNENSRKSTNEYPIFEKLIPDGYMIMTNMNLIGSVSCKYGIVSAGIQIGTNSEEIPLMFDEQGVFGYQADLSEYFHKKTAIIYKAIDGLGRITAITNYHMIGKSGILNLEIDIEGQGVVNEKHPVLLTLTARESRFKTEIRTNTNHFIWCLESPFEGKSENYSLSLSISGYDNAGDQGLFPRKNIVWTHSGLEFTNFQYKGRRLYGKISIPDMSIKKSILTVFIGENSDRTNENEMTSIVQNYILTRSKDKEGKNALFDLLLTERDSVASFYQLKAESTDTNKNIRYRGQYAIYDNEEYNQDQPVLLKLLKIPVYEISGVVRVAEPLKKNQPVQLFINEEIAVGTVMLPADSTEIPYRIPLLEEGIYVLKARMDNDLTDSDTPGDLTGYDSEVVIDREDKTNINLNMNPYQLKNVDGTIIIPREKADELDFIFVEMRSKINPFLLNFLSIQLQEGKTRYPFRFERIPESVYQLKAELASKPDEYYSDSIVAQVYHQQNQDVILSVYSRLAVNSTNSLMKSNRMTRVS